MIEFIIGFYQTQLLTSFCMSHFVDVLIMFNAQLLNGFADPCRK